MKITSFRGPHRFLSNFYTGYPITYEGIKYPTSEHAYQAAKTLDINKRQQIRDCKTPGDAKRAKPSWLEIRPDWEEVKYQIMVDILTLKFKHPLLREWLKNTGTVILEEGTHWHDNIWGNCLCPKCETIPGQNLLGIALMKVRSNL